MIDPFKGFVIFLLRYGTLNKKYKMEADNRRPRGASARKLEKYSLKLFNYGRALTREFDFNFFFILFPARYLEIDYLFY